MREVNVVKSVKDLKLLESIDEVYVYMDNNKSTLECYYNNELKLPLNLLKIAQKYLNIPIKKVFGMIDDVKLKYNNDASDVLNIVFYFK